MSAGCPPHHWLLEAPAPGGEAARGTCARCGAERTFGGGSRTGGRWARARASAGEASRRRARERA